MTPDDVAKLKVAELRDALAARGLDTKGLKAELAARLTAALQDAGEPASTDAPPASADGPSPGRPKRGRAAAAAAAPDTDAAELADAPAAAAAEPAGAPPFKRGRVRQDATQGAGEGEEGEAAEGDGAAALLAVDVAPTPAPVPQATADPHQEPAPGERQVPPATGDVAPPAVEPVPAAARPPPVAVQPPPPPPPSTDVVVQDTAHAADDDGGDGEDDGGALASAARPPPAVVSGRDCPQLASINRAALDFDFEAACSVTLSPVNVYACLVCGKYFAGRGPKTPAAAHALGSGHAIFLRLADGAAYVLPDGARVEDPALDSVRAVLNPVFTDADVAALDAPPPRWARALDGTPFAPGLVGINNLKATDYAAVVVQALARVPPLRNFFLRPATHRAAAARSPLVHRFGALLRKLWNPAAFKGHVSPHEFMQAVLAASGGRFGTDARADAASFFVWLVNALHTDLAVPPAPGGPAGPAAARLAAGRRTIVSDCFRGELEIVTEPGTGGVPRGAAPRAARAPFWVLALDLPPAPLYRDALERNAIPQVPVFELLRRYDGVRVDDGDPAGRAGRRTLRITRAPRYLATHVKRFTRNAFFGEKNPTIVTFPVKGLDLGRVLPVGDPPGGAPARYDLVANIVHDGPAGGGRYRAHVLRASEAAWYAVDDLAVTETLPQVVALSEAYVQVYERVDEGAGGEAMVE